MVEPYELGLTSLMFDENTLDDIGTLKSCISMMADLGLIEKFNIPYDVGFWFKKIPKNPYTNQIFIF